MRQIAQADTMNVSEFRDQLLSEHAALEADGAETEADRKPVVLDQQSVGRLSRMDAMQGQAMAQALQARRAGRLRAISAALTRIDDGEFGYCDDCGEEIAEGRLRLDPCAMKCRDCAG